MMANGGFMGLGKLFVIEAIDGAGKATQTKKLMDRLEGDGYPVYKVEFPNYQSNSSALIKMYLNGEFGQDANQVNPFAASTFYAVDRYASYVTEWKETYQNGGIILADRYTTSNMVHQAAKISDPEEWQKYLTWLYDLEFEKFQLPVPDDVIFLDMPPEYAGKLRESRPNKAGDDSNDIHEKNLVYLESSYLNALKVADKYRWIKVSCVANAKIKSIESIHEDVYEIIKRSLTYSIDKR